MSVIILCVIEYSKVIGLCKMHKALKLHASWSNTGSLSLSTIFANDELMTI
jgi:hypothetical protein